MNIRNEMGIATAPTMVFKVTHTHRDTHTCMETGNLSKVSGFFQCQYAVCDTELQFCKMLPLGGTGRGYTGSLCSTLYNLV